jgi:general secretion pathway protein I
MRARGFTLVEVMVALAIVAIALPALLMALYQQVDDTAYLRDKTLAEMVAANQLAHIRLVVAHTRSLTAGKDNGVDTLAERQWYWWAETTSTQQPNFFRIKIDVALQEKQKDHPLYSLTTYMSGDLQIDQTGLPNGGTNNSQNGATPNNSSSDSGGGSDTGVNTSNGGSDSTSNGGESGAETSEGEATGGQ